MPDEFNLEERLFNLANNYEKHKAGNEKLCDRDGLSVIRQTRPFKSIVHYAVIGDTPLAYCAGREIRRPSGLRFVITSTFVHPAYRRQGVASAIYTAIIDQGITLVSDWDLSDGAKALWAHLMREEPMGDVIYFQDGYVAKRRGRKTA